MVVLSQCCSEFPSARSLGAPSGSATRLGVAWNRSGRTDSLAPEMAIAVKVPGVRMAKIGTHTAVILDVDSDRVTFQEHDPFEPSNTWEGSLSWGSDSRVAVQVGPYLLDAAIPQDARLHYFQGSESGPWGDHDMDLFVLSEDPDRLWHLPNTWWLAIREGSWTPVRQTPTASASSFEILPERRVGCAVGMFESTDSSLIASFSGIYGGRQMDLRVRRPLSRSENTARLEADIDARDRFEKWSWCDSGGFVPDFQQVRLVGESCLLYPIEVLSTPQRV